MIEARSQDFAPCGLFTFNDNGIIEAANTRLHQLLDADPGSVIGESIDTLLTVSSRIFFSTHFLPLLRWRRSVDETYINLRHRSGEPVAVLVTAGSEGRADGTTLFDCAVMAMGKRHQLEIALTDAKKAAEEATIAKDMFLAVVSHELRTPLTAILGWVEIGLSPKADAAKKERALSVIQRSALAQAKLIEDLLDISRIVSGNLRLSLKTIDLAAVVEAVVETAKPVAEAKSITLVLDADPDLRNVLADPDRIHQVVWNLVSNAIKFTPEGGAVSLTLRQLRGRLVLCVKDSGVGIPTEQVPFLFDRFWQADFTAGKSAGLGLGLPICKKIMELHGGSIRAKSEGSGLGATFSIGLPLPLSRPV